ncbi:MAG TPA: transcriptional repressor LexA [Anaerolineae bacterium]|nr:transcriptional repressor LexA [Anaerolineae bacterium]HXV99436.1 transcriptional repressor LexA [Anaerolineae bacterium]
MRISDKQKEMLAFIENFVGENGYPPTHEEIRTGLKISTKSLVNYHLEALEDAAMLSRSPNTPRGIRLMSERDTFSVPFAGELTISAPANPADLNEQDAIELTCDIVSNTPNLYALKVQGEAMLDALVNDGDIVIIQRQNQVKNGDLVAVRLTDQNRLGLKHYYRENGHVRLQPADPSLQPLIVKPNAVQVEGKVMAIIRQVT